MNIAPLENLRGDYLGMAPDWTVPQHADLYSAEDQAVWRLLVERQTALARRYACDEFLEGLDTLGIGDTIPDFEAVNARLMPLTGWQIVGVPGLIPDAAFYDHLAHRRFPVTRWIRKEHELDYLVEPDVFHDFFGHVPMLLDPTFADFMEAYGKAGARAIAMDALAMLARIYWYTVEFGLIDEGFGLKAYGAGIVSSAGELVFSTEDAQVLRLEFEPVRVMRTAYNIDRFQSCYFVLESFDELLKGLVDLDFGPIYERWRETEPLPAGEFHDGDRPYRGNLQA